MNRNDLAQGIRVLGYLTLLFDGKTVARRSIRRSINSACRGIIDEHNTLRNIGHNIPVKATLSEIRAIRRRGVEIMRDLDNENILNAGAYLPGRRGEMSIFDVLRTLIDLMESEGKEGEILASEILEYIQNLK